MYQSKAEKIAIPATPPTTPPAIAPEFEPEELLDPSGSVPDVDVAVAETGVKVSVVGVGAAPKFVNIWLHYQVNQIWALPGIVEDNSQLTPSNNVLLLLELIE